VQEERNALKDLSEHHCPFVVHTVGCFQDDKRIYFVMVCSRLDAPAVAWIAWIA
jgi:hypothetical protein